MLNRFYEDPYPVLAYSLNRLGRAKEASEIAIKALEIVPNDSFALSELVLALKNLSDEDKAKEIFRDFLSKKSIMNPDAIERIAYFYYLLRQVDIAIELFKQVLEIRPNDTQTNNNLGYLYFLKGEYTIAERLFEKSIECDPKNERPHFNLGALYISIGEKEKGTLEYKAAIDINSNVIADHIKDLEEMWSEHLDWNWIDIAKKSITEIQENNS
jgi:tetratricopeptide (TPR) repeat protein